MNLQSHKNDASESRKASCIALLLVCLDSTRVWFSCKLDFQFLQDCVWFFGKSNHMHSYTGLYRIELCIYTQAAYITIQT